MGYIFIILHHIMRVPALLLILATAFASSEGAVAVDSVPAQPDSVVVRGGLMGLYDKVVAYFASSNEVKPAKRFDISFIGGPYYSTDSKFGIGLVAAGLYRRDTTDTVTQPSSVSLSAKATTAAHFELSAYGTHFFTNDKARIGYDVEFAYIATKFWGIGYEMDINDDNAAKYRYLEGRASADYVWRLARHLYLGPMMEFNYVNATSISRPELWEGLPLRTFNLGMGITLQYDSRDLVYNASKGWLLRLDQRFYPRWFFNKHAFSLTEIEVATYRKLWKGAVLAARFHSRLTYGNTPWGLLGTLGGSDNMRGYFEGRYRDKCEADLCVELRQKVWRRNGVVAWVGAGTVFPRFEDLRWRKVLPNFGVGYRWEFKDKVNVRVDLGFGRHQKGFIFSINEAF